MRNALVNTFARLRNDEKGVTLVEYGIALILAITVGTLALGTLGTAVNTQLGQATACLDADVCTP